MPDAEFFVRRLLKDPVEEYKIPADTLLLLPIDELSRLPVRKGTEVADADILEECRQDTGTFISIPRGHVSRYIHLNTY